MPKRCTVLRWLLSLSIAAGMLQLAGESALAQPLPIGKPYSDQQQAWIAQRNKAREEALSLAKNDIDQGVQYTEKLLAYDRQVFGNVHRETADSLSFMRRLYYRQRNFKQAVAMEREVRDITVALLGEKHWRVRQQDYVIKRIEHMGTLTDDARRLWPRATELQDQAIDLLSQQNATKAMRRFSRPRS